MWKCVNCGKENRDDRNHCWHCSMVKHIFGKTDMTPKELADLRVRMSKLTDGELRKIVNVDFKDYRKEAVALAKAELERRGLLPPPATEPIEKHPAGVYNPANVKPDVAPTNSNKGVTMRERMLSVLNIIKSRELLGLKDFREEDDSSFEIKTPYAEYNHRTWLKYESNNDDSAVRMELTHLFGYLDVEKGIDNFKLLRLLSMNVPSFQNSSAYIGAKDMDGTVFVALHATPIFLTKWSDEDIADALSIYLFDLATGLMVVPPSPITQFGSE
jgi:hypothetical protein